MPDDTHANSTAHIDRVNEIFDSIDGVETHLSDLETLIDEADTPPGVEDQLRAVDEQLFEIKQQLAESWGVECFTQPVADKSNRAKRREDIYNWLRDQVEEDGLPETWRDYLYELRADMGLNVTIRTLENWTKDLRAELEEAEVVAQ